MRKCAGQQKMYYFSDRLKSQLAQMPLFPLTIIEAPSGFGKTTAVREYLKDNLSDACEYWYTCLGEPSSMAWRGICELLSNASGSVADNLKRLDMPSMDTLFYITAYLRALDCPKETYLVVDNYQLAGCDVPRELLDAFSMHGNSNLHMIFITQQLGARQQLSTHNPNIHSIDAPVFFFDREGTDILFRMEGIKLRDEELEGVFMSTEGWVSAIRLQIINFRETGSFGLCTDIEQLVETAIWNRLSREEKDFLLSISVMDNFSARQAAIMLGSDTLPEKIENLLKANDFIRYLPDKHLYSIHSILLDYLRNRFYYHRSEEYQSRTFAVAGKAYSESLQYYPAARFFLRVGDFDSILSLPFTREYFDSQKEELDPEFLMSIIARCPDETLLKYPGAMIMFGYLAISCGQQEAYDKLRRLVGRSVESVSAFDSSDRRIIRAFHELLSALGDFNNLEFVIKRQAKAWDLLQGPVERTYSSTPWLFGSISVLDMFWRESGGLEKTISLLEEARPINRSLLHGYGAGAADLLQAEALLMRGEDSHAEILCHKALYNAHSYRQTAVCLCAEFALARIAILRGDAEGYFTAVNNIQREASRGAPLYIARMAEHCLSAISLELGLKDNVCPWLYDMESIKRVLYAPNVPHAQSLHLRLMIMEKRYGEFFALSQLLLDGQGQEGGIRFAMPRVKRLICLAIANLNNGNTREAQKFLGEALELTLSDKIYLPFAQDIRELSPLLDLARSSVSDKEGLNTLIELCWRHEKGACIIRKAIGQGQSPLTPREREIAALAKERLSAREIANKLFISDTTVRTILKSIYSKLEVHSKNELVLREF